MSHVATTADLLLLVVGLDRAQHAAAVDFQDLGSGGDQRAGRRGGQMLELEANANRLLARQARLRLEAEVVRDVCLSASGLLNPAVGGPSVRPPQPEGLGRLTQVNRPWVASTGPDRCRSSRTNRSAAIATHMDEPMHRLLSTESFQRVMARPTGPVARAGYRSPFPV